MESAARAPEETTLEAPEASRTVQSKYKRGRPVSARLPGPLDPHLAVPPTVPRPTTGAHLRSAGRDTSLGGRSRQRWSWAETVGASEDSARYGVADTLGRFFNEDVVRHYQSHLANRRTARPATEYQALAASEWSDFETHFDKRKVGLGQCGRPYATPCEHEHACIRYPMPHVDPAAATRFDQLDADLVDRRARAEREGWLGGSKASI